MFGNAVPIFLYEFPEMALDRPWCEWRRRDFALGIRAQTFPINLDDRRLNGILSSWNGGRCLIQSTNALMEA